jgi:hypothetical protein
VAQQQQLAGHGQSGSLPGSPATPGGLKGSGRSGLPPGALVDRQLGVAGWRR